jgi:integrase
LSASSPSTRSLARSLTPAARVTCAALLIATGAHPKLISTRLGHSSIAITMDRYGHLLPALDIAVTAGLEASFRAAQGA